MTKFAENLSSRNLTLYNFHLRLTNIFIYEKIENLTVYWFHN
jgi:hypothetical protein